MQMETSSLHGIHLLQQPGVHNIAKYRGCKRIIYRIARPRTVGS